MKIDVLLMICFSCKLLCHKENLDLCWLGVRVPFMTSSVLDDLSLKSSTPSHSATSIDLISSNHVTCQRQTSWDSINRMTEKSVIMLDWRERPATSDMISKILAKLLDADHLSKLEVELEETSYSRGKSFYSLHLAFYVFLQTIKKFLGDSVQVMNLTLV